MKKKVSTSEQFISEGMLGSFTADKALKEANKINEQKRLESFKDAEKQAEIKIYNRLFELLDNNLNLGVVIDPIKEENGTYGNKTFNEELLNSYILKSKNKNVYISNFNIDKEEKTEVVTYRYDVASINSKNISRNTGSYNISSTSNGYSASPNTTSVTEYYLKTTTYEDSVMRSLQYKIIKAENIKEVISKEKEYAPYFKLHKNYTIYSKNINKGIKKSDCIINNVFLLIVAIGSLLFSVYSLISILFSYLRLYGNGDIGIYIGLKNFILSVDFVIPFLPILIMQSTALIVFLVFKKKYKYLSGMELETKNFKGIQYGLNSEVCYRWDERGSMKISCINSNVCLLLNVAAILLSTIDSLVWSIIISIIGLICFFMTLSIFVISIHEIKINDNFKNWNKFVTGMSKFKSNGDLNKCEKLVAEIKNFTVKIY